MSTSTTDEDAAAATTASSYMVGNGILMGAASSSDADSSIVRYQPAPFSLRPTPFPQRAWTAIAGSETGSFNRLVHQVAQSYDSWTKDALQTAAKGDADFTGRLVELADEVMVNVRAGRRAQNVVLGILRSDYMLHCGGDSKNNFDDAVPYQVELNTIASSFGCLSSKITTTHQTLQKLSGDDSTGTLPENKAAENLVDGLAAAYHEYVRQRSAETANDTTTIQPVIVMVVLEGDTNSCDQRELEMLLLQRYDIRMIRRTMRELATQGRYNTQSLFRGQELLVPQQDDSSAMYAVAVAYYRAGYTPDHYPSSVEWEGRKIVEHSAAIKCPDVFYHCVGAKKIQQKLAVPGVLRQFCTSDEEETRLSSFFTGLYSLGEGDDSAIVRDALANPQDYVLKPQREGGGHNLYDDDLVEALSTMSKEQRGGFILMSKIRPPSTPGVLVRGGQVVYKGETVCEVGVFGVYLREYGEEGSSDGKVLMDRVGGHILRSKSTQTDEGGVAAGYAFLSSPCLV